MPFISGNASTGGGQKRKGQEFRSGRSALGIAREKEGNNDHTNAMVIGGAGVEAL